MNTSLNVAILMAATVRLFGLVTATAKRTGLWRCHRLSCIFGALTPSDFRFQLSKFQFPPSPSALLPVRKDPVQGQIQFLTQKL